MADATGLWILLLLALALGVWRTLLWRPRQLPGVTRERPWLLGHRGLRGRLPENTLAAFRAALEAGLDGVECDVQRTRDGVLVVRHDAEVAGTPLSRLTLSELRRLEPLAPTLGELLRVVQEHPGTLLNVELKYPATRAPGAVGRAVEAVRAAGLLDRTVFSSFDPLALARLRLAAPRARVGLLYSPDSRWWLRRGWLAGWLHVDALHPQAELIDDRLMERSRRRGLMVNAWTVNDPLEVRRLLHLGASGIMADDPHGLRSAAGR